MTHFTNNVTFFYTLTNRHLNRPCLQMDKGGVQIVVNFYNDAVTGNCLYVIFFRIKMMSVFISVRHIRK